MKKRSKAYKIKAKTEPGKLLTVLRSKTYLVYVPTKNTMIKTLFIKLYEPKNPLILKKVPKLIRIRPLNDVAIIKYSTGERVSLDLLEIDDINSSKLTTPKAPKSPRPLELPVLGPSKPSESKNRSLKSIFKLSEEFIKFIDSLNPDEIQLNLISNFYYRIKVKIFKKKLDKNNSIPNIYKQTLKSPNIKKWLATIFNEFE